MVSSGEMTIAEFERCVGQEIGTSDWIAVDQSRIDAFANCTEDQQFIHVDPERARSTPFGGTVAHGFLTLSMLAKLAAMATPKLAVEMSVNYGFDRIRFIVPVRSGERIRGRFTLRDFVWLDATRCRQTVEVVVEIEGHEKPALITDWIVQHFV